MKSNLSAPSVVGLSVAIGLGFAAASTAIVAPAAQAQDSAAFVLVRQDVMKAFGARLKEMASYLQEDAVSAEDAAARAMEIAIIAPAIPALFPEGTSADDMPGKTRAKAEIWQDWAKFEAAAKNLSEEAGKLAEALASGDKAAAGAQMEAAGKNGCGGCHEPFRVPKDS